MSARPPELVIRADANVRIGSGHVMRCLALGQAWCGLGRRATFACSEIPNTLRERLSNEGFSVVSISSRRGSECDAAETHRLAEQVGAEWVVLDGYDFQSKYRLALQAPGRKLLVIDDLGHMELPAADAILNQNLYADERLYTNCASRTRLLLSGSYALLRQEFIEWKDWQRKIPNAAQKIVVIFGGADERNMTGRVLQALAEVRIDGLQVTAILGGINPHVESLQALAQDLPYPIQFAHNVGDMPRWMAWADLAVAAAGSTCWEMAFMGLPVLAVPVAENQVGVSEAIQSHGLGRNLVLDPTWINGSSDDQLAPSEIARRIAELAADRAGREAMSLRGRQVIDGQGAMRVARYLARPNLRLRPATQADARLLWEWRNEPHTRQMSFSQEEIPFEGHVLWLGKKLANEDCQILIAEDAAGTPVGQIRFDIHGRRAEISIVLDRHRRGHGVGTSLIRIATEQLFETNRISAVDAYIKLGNDGSCRAFEKAGYKLLGHEQVSGTGACRYVAERVDVGHQRLAG